VAGAIDLKAGSNALAGANLFTVDKDPLNQLDQGVSGVVGKQAASTGNQVTSLFQGFLNGLLGFNLDGSGGDAGFEELNTYFANLETFLGELNPLDPNFNVDQAAHDFINNILLPTNLFAGSQLPQDIVDVLWDVLTGSSQTGKDAADLRTAWSLSWSNLGALLGLPDLQATVFDPIEHAGEWLLDIFVPAGSLTTSTPIPPHLLDVMPGSTSVLSNNLLPDPGFDDPKVIDGEGKWDWSGTVGRTVNSTVVGSVHTTGASELRQLDGVPINTKPGQQTDFEVWVSWSGVVAGPGAAIQLSANAWDINHNLIAADPQRVLASITAPATDQPTWQHLTGSHQAPAGTSYITLCLEVTATVSAGDVYFDDAVHYLHGVIDSSWLGNVSNIPQIDGSSVAGMQGIEDLVTTFNNMFDGLGSALANAPKSGLDLSQLFSLMQTTAQQAWDAINLAVFHQQTLTQRTNKPVRAGLDPTSESTFHLTDFTAGSTTPMTAVAAGTSIIAMFRPAESAKKGFVEFLAQGNGGTNIFVNVYKVNPSTGVKTALWNSSDISSLVPNGSVGYVRALIPGASQPTVAAGDLFALGIVNAGSGTLSVATKQIPTPNHPTAYPPNLAAVRTIASTGGATPASITDSQITYNSTLPYINFGILDVPANYMPNQVDEYVTNGTYTYTIPDFAKVAGTKLDLVGLGAGGGGGGSGYFLGGEGGLGGTWNAITLVCGVDYPTTATSLTIVVGNGGPGGPGGNGTNGDATTISWTDPSSVAHTLTCAGGQAGLVGGFSNHGGASQGIGPGDFTWQGQQYFGGPTTLYTPYAGYPGAGGSGAGPYADPGADGADGYVSITARQT
jgi:hypothetical protein